MPDTASTDPVVLEGFTIRGGSGYTLAGQVISYKLGGGVYVVNANLQVIGCAIVDNQANIAGGGPTLGSVAAFGGGFEMRRGTLLMRDCVVAGNSAAASGAPPSGGSALGGGVSTLRTTGSGVTTAVFIGCSFSGNGCSGSSNAEGGGIALGGPSVLINCDIAGNSSNDSAAGVSCQTGTNVTLINCRITGNFIPNGVGTSPGISAGGAIGGTLTMHACTVFDNFASNPGSAAIVNDGGTVGITDSIIFSNSGSAMNGTATVQYSCVQGGFAGEGNIDADPLFVDATNGNLRLQDGSPCRDTGNRSLLPADAHDLDGDANTTETLSRDFDLLRRIVNGQVDMGAYEWQRTCLTDISRSSPGMAGDGFTNIGDLLAVIAGWGPCDQCNADVNNDDVVNITDLLGVIAGWGACQP
jgi:hypothetical protein